MPGCPFGNLAAEVGTQDAVIRDKVREVFAGYSAAFEQVVRDAQATGEIGPLDVPAAARGLLACLEGAMLVAKAYNDASLIEQLGHAATGLLRGWADAPPPPASMERAAGPSRTRIPSATEATTPA